LTTPLLTPLAISHQDVLRAVEAGPGSAHDTLYAAGVAKATGRVVSNVRRDLPKLFEANLVKITPPRSALGDIIIDGLTDHGREVLAAIRRAEGDLQAQALALSRAPPDGYLMLRHAQVIPDPLNPRKHFDEDAIAELADSIAKDGLLENLVVREGEADHGGGVTSTVPLHRLVAGERRWRAIRKLILDGRWAAEQPIACKVITIDDADHRRIALVENLQRKDLRPVDEALALQELIRVTRKSTAEIAEEIGFTQRFVQQRLQLLQLTEKQRADLNEGRLTIEDARRIAAQPKPKKLEPVELLMLAECLVKIATDPLKSGYGESEVSYLAKDDAVFGELCKRGAISFTEKEWHNKKALIRRGYAVRELIEAQLPDLFGDDGDKADQLLDKLRTQVIDAAAAAKCASDGKYLTSWLNGPFELSESAKAELAAEKASKATEREANKRRKAAREKRLQSFVALDCRLQATSAGPLDSEIPRMLAKLKIALPVELKGGRIFDAKGEPVADCNWRFGDEGEAVNLLLATLINAAAGFELGAQGDIEEAIAAQADDGVEA
jgi:ParB/RepB/Spo0J family partition protein